MYRDEPGDVVHRVEWALWGESQRALLAREALAILFAAIFTGRPQLGQSAADSIDELYRREHAGR